MSVWKISFSEKDSKTLREEIKDESSVGDIFNNQVEDNIYILIQGNQRRSVLLAMF